MTEQTASTASIGNRMHGIRKIRVANGMYWVEIPDEELRVLCGCPADAVKLLARRGLIVGTEVDGVAFETGPNAILLSDFMIQNGQIANLAEFPVLQMLYRQGMIIPKHPNNTGAKPILIGLVEILQAQSQYIYRGNYGLITQKEIEDAGVESSLAAEMMRLKRRFAFDSIRTTEELIDLRPIVRDVIPLTDNVFLHRLGPNRYEFIYEGQRVEVDLNLAPGEEFEPAYRLGDHLVSKQYFSVVHTGEGDGWDVNRPCMASLLTYQDRFYLIDAGPKVMNSLIALGISINEIDGIFHTHAHDDHFAGMAALLRSDHKLRYYATPLVRASVTKKLSALMSIEESSFGHYFEVHDLQPEAWNDIDGLEVMPVYSPHPVETNILRFRVRWLDGYRTYAHLADITSCRVLEKMITDDPSKSGVTRESFERAKAAYLLPADLKKIDIGGGLIHGDAEDFEHDRSARILLAHTEHPLTARQREIGSNASFGMQDVLIRSARDTILDEACDYLRAYFPDVPNHEITAFTNYPIEVFNAGSIIIRKTERCEHVFLVLRGVVEALDVETGVSAKMTAGSLVGEIAGVEGDAAQMTYRTVSYIKALRIPLRHFADFVRRNNLLESILDLRERIEFLRSTWLFEEAMSYQTLGAISNRMTEVTLDQGVFLADRLSECLFLITSGRVRLSADDCEIETLGVGEVCGETCMLLKDTGLIIAATVEPVTGYSIPIEALEDIPIVRWKLLEMLKRRIQKLTTVVDLEWSEEYALDGGVIDAQHHGLFDAVKEVIDSFSAQAPVKDIVNTTEGLLVATKRHFEAEEAILEKAGYPDLESHRSAHAESYDRLVSYRAGLVDGAAAETSSERIAFFKNWLINHLLIEDSPYRSYVRK
jgi:hemerythrin